MRAVITSILASLMFLAFGCSGGGFGGKKNKTDRSEQTSQGSDATFESSLDNSEAEVADEPVAVGGAFLTCKRLNLATTKNPKAEAKCQFNDGNGNKIKTSSVAKKWKWSYQGNPHDEVKIATKDSPTTGSVKYVYTGDDHERVNESAAKTKLVFKGSDDGTDWQAKTGIIPEPPSQGATIDENNENCTYFSDSGGCFHLGESAQSCTTVCSQFQQDYDAKATNYANSNTDSCKEVLDGVNAPETGVEPENWADNINLSYVNAGCSYYHSGYDGFIPKGRFWGTLPTANFQLLGLRRVCGCQ